MTPRERVRMALNHQEPDRVPVDLWGSASRIHTEQYQKIAEQLGWDLAELMERTILAMRSCEESVQAEMEAMGLEA